MDKPLVLVLEDYHLIRNPDIQRALTYSVEHLPRHVHLIVTLRADPPFPLARWRARGQLTEIRAADLRFRGDETTALLKQSLPLSLTPAQITALEERVEGWAAGLQLAALALTAQRATTDAEKFIQSFTGSHRYILDYLAQEVLMRQSRPIQNFLLATSILERFNAALCDAVREPSENPASPSAAILHELERANLFIIPLDETREWYRYHQLFAQVLQHQLQQKDPAAIPRSKQRASAWFEKHGLIAEAIPYALDARAYGDAARLIQAASDDTLARGEHVTLTKWLDAFPEAELSKYPALLLTRGFVANLKQDNAQAARYLQSAERAIELAVTTPTANQELAGQAAALRAFIALYQNQLDAAIRAADMALKNLPRDSSRLRARVSIQKGAALTWQNEVAQGLALFRQAKTLAAESDDIFNLLWAEYSYCSTLISIGELPHAYNALQNMLTFAREQRREQNVYAQLMYADLSEICYEWNDLTCAREYAEQAERFARQFQLPRLQNIAQTNIQRALYAQGEHARAQELLTHTLADIERLQLPVRYAYMSLAMRGEWLLREENPPAARDWIHAHGVTEHTAYNYLREPELFVLARAYIALQEVAAAQSIAQTISDAAAQMQRPIGALRAHILDALLAAHREDIRACRAALTDALAIAAPRRIVRVWLDMDSQMLILLNDLRPEFSTMPHGNFANALLSAFAPPLPTARAPIVTPLVENLTEREVQVLQLVAQGKADKQIAAELIVATGTVKRHLNNIYGKLGVNSRTQALARARGLGLL